MYLPRDADGNINLKGAHDEITNLLNTYPAFRSQNPISVCMFIGAYFTDHPDQSNVNRESEGPD